MEQSTSLKNLLPTGRQQWMVYISCLMVFAGFSCSRMVISLGVIGLIISGLLSLNIKETWSNFRHRPAFYINILFFLVILLSGINSTDTSMWLNFLRIKIPFLILPFAFCGFTFFDRAFLNKLLLAFVICMSVSATCVMIRYGLHYREITEHILIGSSVPVPFSHIRYTLLLVFSFFSLLWLWEQHIIASRNVLLLIAGLFFIVIHVLSSRSGWLALYAGLLLYFSVYIIRSRQYLIGLIMFVSLFTLPIIMYQLIPSFHNKIVYIRYTMNQLSEGHSDGMSDGMRFNSWKVGMEIIKDYPLAGTGVGDLQQVSKEYSRRMFPDMQNDDDRKMPHNEFIWIWAASGVFGFLAYCTAFLYPFLTNFREKNWLFAILFLLFFSSFLTEYSIEEQIGSTFYLVFLLIFLAHFNHRHIA